MFFYKVKLFT